MECVLFPSAGWTLRLGGRFRSSTLVVFPMDQPKQKGLPVDTVYHILTRLPVKTLTRFRCVSKPWNSLISSPPFKQDYYCHAQQNPLLLVTKLVSKDHSNTLRLSTYNKEGALLRKSSMAVPRLDTDIVRIQSCKGLVCLYYNYINRLYVRICNPSTEALKSLPQRPEGYTCCIGFGYAASTNEFKVVRFFRSNPVDDIRVGNDECELFTLGTSHWRKASSPPFCVSMWVGDVPYLNGALHLLSSSKDGDSIAAFDIESEEYKMIPLPGYFREVSTDRNACPCVSLMELGGLLGLTFNRCGEEVEIWLLKDYDNGKWVKQYSIDLSMISNSFAIPLAILGDECILLDVYHHQNLELLQDLLYYNPREKKITQKMGANNSSARFYVESFLSVGRR